MSDNQNKPNSSRLMDSMLKLSYPMWFSDLKDRPHSYLQERAKVCSKEIAVKGDILMYGSKKKGRAGEVFNRLSEGMACLTLITKNPVPFGKIVFLPNGSLKHFKNEQEANEYVWPKNMSEMQD